MKKNNPKPNKFKEPEAYKKWLRNKENQRNNKSTEIRLSYNIGGADLERLLLKAVEVVKQKRQVVFDLKLVGREKYVYTDQQVEDKMRTMLEKYFIVGKINKRPNKIFKTTVNRLK